MSNELVKKMWKDLAKSPVVMVGLNKNAKHSEPIHAQLDEEANGYFWFYNTTDNRIAGGGKAMVQFSSKGHDLFACIVGHLVEETDKDVISRHWSKPVEAWHQGSIDDPKLRMMRFDLASAEVWTVDSTVAGMIKLSSGATLSAEEIGKHAKIAF